MAGTADRLVLASASTARAALLRGAGLDFAIEPADVDEALLKREMRQTGGSAVNCATALATEKACVVSRRCPAALVIGADQILVAGDEWFDKPHNLGEARAQLCELRGRSHTLETVVCVVQGERVLWRAASRPVLTMRDFSDAFLDAYLADEGESVCVSVGAYRIEGRGAQLFARISGDYFAVLGLPLIELLEFLRERGVVPT